MTRPGDLPGLVPLALAPAEVGMLADALRALALVVTLRPETLAAVRAAIAAHEAGGIRTEWEWLEITMQDFGARFDADRAWYAERGVTRPALETLREQLLAFRRRLLEAQDAARP